MNAVIVTHNCPMQIQDDDYRNGMVLVLIIGAADIAFLTLLAWLALS